MKTLRRPEGIPAILVNDAYALAQPGDSLFFGDNTWYVWRKDAVKAFQGPVYHSAQSIDIPMTHRATARIEKIDDPAWLFGKDSGTKAVSLAYRLGFETILLAGFDLCSSGDATHFHAGYPQKRDYRRDWAAFRAPQQRLFAYLRGKGVRLFSLTDPAPVGVKRIFDVLSLQNDADAL